MVCSRLLQGVVLTAGLLSSGVAAQAFVVDRAYQDAASLSVEEKAGRAAGGVDRMKATLKLALERLQAARDRQDIIQVNCVNDKLSAIKGLLKISEQSEASLREAQARSDDELINHEFTKITIASGRVESLRVEVEGCVGEASQYTGGTVVEPSIDDGIRSDEPADVPVESLTVFEPIDTDAPVAVSGSE